MSDIAWGCLRDEILALAFVLADRPVGRLTEEVEALAAKGTDKAKAEMPFVRINNASTTDKNELTAFNVALIVQPDLLSRGRWR